MLIRRRRWRVTARRLSRPAGRAWPEFAASLREGLRYLLTARTLLILTAVQMVVNLCLSVEKLIIYDARETLGLSSPLIGMVVAAGGAGGLAGALCAAPLARWAGEMRLVLLAIAAAGASVACMCLASAAISLAAANLGYGAALVVASLVNRTQWQRLVPRNLLGRVTSTVRVLFLATDPLGVIAAGAATVALVVTHAWSSWSRGAQSWWLRPAAGPQACGRRVATPSGETRARPSLPWTHLAPNGAPFPGPPPDRPAHRSTPGHTSSPTARSWGPRRPARCWG